MSIFRSSSSSSPSFLKRVYATVADGGHSSLRAPLVYQGNLDHFKYAEVTPLIGRQYSQDLQLQDLLHADDSVLRDFAHVVSSRAVVSLKAQRITGKEMQEFMKRFHRAAGAPPRSELHIHPSASLNGFKDASELQTISSEAQMKSGGDLWKGDKRRFWGSEDWHTDISWEKAPSDYAMLKLNKTPPTGGDTLFASGEALYDRLSPSFAKYLESLTAVHVGQSFLDEVQRTGVPLYAGERGSPANVGQDLRATHPVVRTNPVTGRKSIYVNPAFTTHIVGLTPFESNVILKFVYKVLVNNQDLQARIRWETGDLAIWDNRNSFHCATYDFDESRSGERACGVGEVPYLDASL